jgi:hypothetical protein
MKQIRYTKKYDNSIIELNFVTIPRKGWFAANVSPMIAVIKGLVPATERSYNGATRNWEVSAEYWTLLAQVLTASDWVLKEVADTDPHANVNVPKDYADNFYHTPESAAPVESSESIAVKLSIFLGVKITTQDVSELKKYYRRRALELHPDRNNGDGAQMSELNRLWTLYTAQDKVVN